MLASKRDTRHAGGSWTLVALYPKLFVNPLTSAKPLLSRFDSMQEAASHDEKLPGAARALAKLVAAQALMELSSSPSAVESLIRISFRD